MNKQDLLNKLNQARPFLSTQDFIPILTHYCFDSENLVAYNDVAAIKLVLDSDIKGAVPGSLMLKMLLTVQEETVRVGMHGEKEVKINSTGSNIKLPLLDPEEFIFDMPDTEGCDLVQVPLSFLSGLEKTLVSIGDDPLHPERSGVLWKVRDNRITLYSTDSRSISIYKWEDQSFFKSDDVDLEVITPMFFCEQLIAIAKNYADELKTVDLYFNTTENYVIVELNKICHIFTRLIKTEEVTDYDSILKAMLPDDDKDSYCEIPVTMTPALERAILLNNTGKLDEQKSHITLTGTQLNIRTQTESGLVSDEVEFPKEFGDVEFFLDPDLLQRSFKYCTQINVGANILALTDDENFQHLISHTSS